MGSQELLFHEDFRDALRHAIKALGGFETVGADLWPTKTRKQAGILLADCLNTDRPAKLDIEDMVAILHMARARHVHCAVYKLLDDAGYRRPEIAPPKTKRQELVERFERLASEARFVADELASMPGEP